MSCVVQFGGQTPLKLALALQRRGRPDSRHVSRFDRPGGGSPAIRRAAVGAQHSPAGERHGHVAGRSARAVAASIGFPVVVRPSYVLGGRAMAIVYDVATLDRYMTQAVDASPEHPILDRQVSRRCLRVRRRCGGRRHGGRRHRRHHGTHRRGRNSFRRQLVRRAAIHLSRAAPRDDPRLHAPDRARVEGDRADERAVRDQGQRRLRPRSESARLANRTVLVESHRRVVRKIAAKVMAGRSACRAGLVT